MPPSSPTLGWCWMIEVAAHIYNIMSQLPQQLLAWLYSVLHVRITRLLLLNAYHS